MGAGGGEVARLVAEALGWRVVDRLSPAEVAEKDESAPGFLDRLLRFLSKAAPEILKAPDEAVPELEEARLVRITEDVVEDVAAEGRVVLVGRAAPAVLSREREALHVKIVAPKSFRIDAVAGRLAVARAEAETVVAESDANRKRYHQQYYRRDWDDAANYHMVLNTAALGLDSVVAAIVGRAKTLWPAQTRERRGARGI
jgi:hypothetical protein